MIFFLEKSGGREAEVEPPIKNSLSLKGRGDRLPFFERSRRSRRVSAKKKRSASKGRIRGVYFNVRILLIGQGLWKKTRRGTKRYIAPIRSSLSGEVHKKKGEKWLEEAAHLQVSEGLHNSRNFGKRGEATLEVNSLGLTPRENRRGSTGLSGRGKKRTISR